MYFETPPLPRQSLYYRSRVQTTQNHIGRSATESPDTPPPHSHRPSPCKHQMLRSPMPVWTAITQVKKGRLGLKLNASLMNVHKKGSTQTPHVKPEPLFPGSNPIALRAISRHASKCSWCTQVLLKATAGIYCTSTILKDAFAGGSTDGPSKLKYRSQLVMEHRCIIEPSSTPPALSSTIAFWISAVSWSVDALLICWIDRLHFSC